MLFEKISGVLVFLPNNLEAGVPNSLSLGVFLVISNASGKSSPLKSHFFTRPFAMSTYFSTRPFDLENRGLDVNSSKHHTFAKF